jgi:SH3 domain protein
MNNVKLTSCSVLLTLLLPVGALAAESAPAADPAAVSTPSAAEATTTSGESQNQNKPHADRYISDDIYTFLHGGPGKQYRILGSVKAGEKVQFLTTDESGKYSQIIDGKGRTAWIVSQELQADPSFRIQIADLQEQNRQLQSRLDNLDSDQARELKEKRELLAKLEKQTNEQQQQIARQTTELAQLHQENDEFQDRLGTREQDKQFRLWREGGIIAGVGLLLGLLLPYLPRPQRRRKDRWMN